jgi:hypothetical protein
MSLPSTFIGNRSAGAVTPTAAPPAQPHFVFGLDLGQTTDPTALAGLEVPLDVGAPRTICFLKRWHLGTPYPEIVADVVKILNHPLVAGSRLMVDQTGVGRAVVDLFRATHALRITGITITGGTQSSQVERDWRVPKNDLVAAVVALSQSDKLHVSPELPDGETLKKELANFRTKITAALNETYSSWREGQHDDLLLAAAMAVWAARRFGVGPYEPPAIARNSAEGRSVLFDAPRGVFLQRGIGDDDEDDRFSIRMPWDAPREGRPL